MVFNWLYSCYWVLCYVTLQSQRVKELLGVQIPEGEAKLLSNGRLTCLICIHRPIFDTINVLSIHRQGKKHLSGMFENLSWIFIYNFLFFV